MKVGTIVWLKIGSPPMVTKLQDINGYWLCSWFDGSDYKEALLAEDQLTTEEPDY